MTVGLLSSSVITSRQVLISSSFLLRCNNNKTTFHSTNKDKPRITTLKRTWIIWDFLQKKAHTSFISIISCYRKYFHEKYYGQLGSQKMKGNCLERIAEEGASLYNTIYLYFIKLVNIHYWGPASLFIVSFIKQLKYYI